MLHMNVAYVRSSEVCIHGTLDMMEICYASGGNGGARVDHESGGEVPPRRSKTLPV